MPINSFKLSRGLEGPQVLLAWTFDSDPIIAEGIKIIRRKKRFPLNDTDGDIVFENSSTTETALSDRDITDGEYLYYKIFYDLSGDWISTPQLQAYILPIDNSNYADRLYNLSSSYDKIADSVADQLPSSESTNEETKEVVNIGKNNAPEGPLKRFLRSMSLEFGNIEGLIREMAKAKDIDTTSPEAIFNLSQFINWDLTDTEDILQKREELRSAVSVYKIKGTNSALQLATRSKTGLESTIELASDFMLFSNDPNKVSIDEITENLTALQEGTPSKVNAGFSVGFSDSDTVGPHKFIHKIIETDERVLGSKDVSELNILYGISGNNSVIPIDMSPILIAIYNAGSESLRSHQRVTVDAASIN